MIDNYVNKVLAFSYVYFYAWSVHWQKIYLCWFTFIRGNQKETICFR